MTTLEFLLFAVCVIADVVLHCVVIVLLRDTLLTMRLRESVRRREWIRQEHEE
jgi:hypothetical protein